MESERVSRDLSIEASDALKAQRPILILLIEDRMNDAKLFQKVLSMSGDAGRYWLIHAKRLSSALSMLQKERVDVVVLDLSLPDSEGFGAIQLIREAAPNVPVVVLTGSDEPESSSSSIRWGAQEFISKNNMNAEVLSKAIKNSIERYRHQGKLERKERESDSLEIDPETQLSTDKVFKVRLNYAFEQARRESKLLGLMLIRVHDFFLGDEGVPSSLKSSAWSFLAGRLNHTLRKNDTIGRLNDNTFALLCYDVHDMTVMHRLASKIVQLLRSPFDFSNGKLKLSFNMGVALSPLDAIESEALIASAEHAITLAEQNGKNKYAFSSKALNVKVNEFATQVSNVKAALSTESFELYASSIHSLQDESIVGFKLKLSSKDPELQNLSHYEILDLSDLANARHEILKWMLQQLSGFSQRFKSEPLSLIRFHLELPSNYLFHKNLGAILGDMARYENLRSDQLVLSVGEELSWSRPERANYLLEELTRNEIRFSLDNFGVGQSSLTQLAHLRRFSLDSIGLSKDLVREATRVEERKEFVGALIQMAHYLNQKVIVKDVTDFQSLELLTTLGSDFVEGEALGRCELLSSWEAILHEQNDNLGSSSSRRLRFFTN